MKNLKTPRTLADCDFTVGYPMKESPVKRAGYVLLGLAWAAVIGVLLVWRG